MAPLVTLITGGRLGEYSWRDRARQQVKTAQEAQHHLLQLRGTGKLAGQIIHPPIQPPFHPPIKLLHHCQLLQTAWQWAWTPTSRKQRARSRWEQLHKDGVTAMASKGHSLPEPDYLSLTIGQKQVGSALISAAGGSIPHKAQSHLPFGTTFLGLHPLKDEGVKW